MKKLKNIASAVQQNGGGSRVNLSYPMLATAKIGQIIPIFHREVIPGDTFNVNTSVFARFAPLSVPAYVDLKLRTMTVFVPYHQLSDGCESFFDDQKKFRGVGNQLPTFTLYDLTQMFTTGTQFCFPASPDYADNFDFSIKNGNSIAYYRFKALGFYAWKVLASLGYNLPLHAMWVNGSAINTTFGNRKLNALPLLAFAHAYNSYMSYSPYTNISVLSTVLETVKRGNASAGVALTYTQLQQILSSILLTYDDNLFTMSWNEAYSSGPDYDTQFSALTKSFINTSNNVISYDGSDGANTSLEDGYFTASQVRLLMKFDDYFRRSNYAGSKDIEQLYSRFGVKIDDFRCRYPYFLRETTQDVRIGDVTSTSDTASADGEQGAVIGSYAGKAISDGGSSFQFSSHDYGMLITLAWYQPKTMMFQGFDKECLRLTPFDYYTPEFDQGFQDLIDQLEWTPQNFNDTVWLTASHGAIPLYAQYLFANPQIIGDFRRYSDFDTWHFGRTDVNYEFTSQSDRLVYMPCTGTIYERIFNVVDTELQDADTIYLTISNEVHASRPMKDYTGKVGLGQGDVDVSLNGTTLN